MEEYYIYIIGTAITVVFALIGILYRNSQANTKDNAKEIKRVDEETDARIDEVKLDVREIQTKLKIKK